MCIMKKKEMDIIIDSFSTSLFHDGFQYKFTIGRFTNA